MEAETGVGIGLIAGATSREPLVRVGKGGGKWKDTN